MGLVKANLPGNEELISTIEEALTASRQHHIDKP
jgi:hypothetical protein